MYDDHRTERVPALLTVSEAAVALRVSAPTVRRALARGELEGRRIGRQWRVDAESISTHREEAHA